MAYSDILAESPDKIHVTTQSTQYVWLKVQIRQNLNSTQGKVKLQARWHLQWANYATVTYSNNIFKIQQTNSSGTTLLNMTGDPVWTRTEQAGETYTDWYNLTEIDYPSGGYIALYIATRANGSAADPQTYYHTIEVTGITNNTSNVGWRQCTPQVYNGSTWKACTPYVYNGSTWKACTAWIYTGTPTPFNALTDLKISTSETGTYSTLTTGSNSTLGYEFYNDSSGWVLILKRLSNGGYRYLKFSTSIFNLSVASIGGGGAGGNYFYVNTVSTDSSGGGGGASGGRNIQNGLIVYPEYILRAEIGAGGASAAASGGNTSLAKKESSSGGFSNWVLAYGGNGGGNATYSEIGWDSTHNLPIQSTAPGAGGAAVSGGYAGGGGGWSYNGAAANGTAKTACWSSSVLSGTSADTKDLIQVCSSGGGGRGMRCVNGTYTVTAPDGTGYATSGVYGAGGHGQGCSTPTNTGASRENGNNGVIILRGSY